MRLLGRGVRGSAPRLLRGGVHRGHLGSRRRQARTRPGQPQPEVAGPQAAEYAAYIKEHAAQLAGPLPLSEVDVDVYDAICIHGGHAPLEDLAYDPDLGRILAEADALKKIIAPVCHGPAGLLSANLPGGRRLFEGRSLAAFSNEEEKLNGTAEYAPWLLQNMLTARGGKVDDVKAWAPHVIEDGNLLSGQNPASAGPLAEKVVFVLNSR
ncbi:type 1 glutamine amidotransferase domain-containing protein [Streptomyces seoulensis]|uniref:type 1 glutamine amidotransferase domain-containing protein n=1 Tax=Streptomyces seoulensis TaxID=73044 RepID=UPI003C2BE027